MGDTERRHNDDAILTALQAIDQRLDVLEEKMKPIDSLKGFWKVIGFVCGGVAILAGGIAGAKYLAGILNHIKLS